MFERLKAFFSDPEPVQVSLPVAEQAQDRKPMYAAAFVLGMMPKIILYAALAAQCVAAGNVLAQSQADVDALMQPTEIVQVVKEARQEQLAKQAEAQAAKTAAGAYSKADGPKITFTLPAEFKEVAEIFSRYVSGGRSAVEVEVVVMRGEGQSGGDAGPHASQSEGKGAGGLYSCRIDNVAGSYAARTISQDGAVYHIDTPTMRAGTLIHEYTHCQTLHHLGFDGPTEQQWQAMTPAEQQLARQVADVQINASEAVSDARAVIELARKDGLGAANEYVQKMTAVRAAADGDSVHSTTFAMQGALLAATTQPDSIKTDQAAFAKAVELGVQNAQLQAQVMIKQSQASPDGQDLGVLTAALNGASASLRASLRGAVEEFASGPVANSQINIAARGVGKVEVHAGDTQDGSFTVTPRVVSQDGSTLLGARLRSFLAERAERAEQNDQGAPSLRMEVPRG